VSAYTETQEKLRAVPRVWLVTGVAGFIGSHLLETLLELGQQVVGLDNFATGYAHNLEQVRTAVGEAKWARFRLIEGDIRDFATCQTAVSGVDYVLHQAALGSVPRSLEQPRLYHDVNVTGFVNMLEAARAAGVARFVYASSSAVYGDEQRLPAIEDRIGKPLSPYALTKALNEQYAHLYATAYGYPSIGFRYFNIFGPRQDPKGAYAAVIPRWVDALLRGEPCIINGDGETTRDYCHVDNVVQANLLAATTDNPDALGRVYNVATGQATTLNELFTRLRDALAQHDPRIAAIQPVYGPERVGDVKHSVAGVGKVCADLSYAPHGSLADALHSTLQWRHTLQPAGLPLQ
jgi:UDP-N-acetylglucosamine 4-epimerase